MKIDNSQPLLTQQLRNESNTKSIAPAQSKLMTSVDDTLVHLASKRGIADAGLSEIQSRELVRKANDAIKLTNSDIEFRLDEEAGRMVFYLKDATSGEVLRQIPDESMLRLSEVIGQFLEKANSSSTDVQKSSNPIAGLLADVKA